MTKFYIGKSPEGKPAIFSERGIVAVCEAGYQETRERDAEMIVKALNDAEKAKQQ